MNAKRRHFLKTLSAASLFGALPASQTLAGKQSEKITIGASRDALSGHHHEILAWARSFSERVHLQPAKDETQANELFCEIRDFSRFAKAHDAFHEDSFEAVHVSKNALKFRFQDFDFNMRYTDAVAFERMTGLA